MKKALPIILALVACAAIVFCVVLNNQKGDLDKAKQAAEAKVNEITAKLTDTENLKKAAEDKVAELEGKLNEAGDILGEATEELAEAEQVYKQGNVNGDEDGEIDVADFDRWIDDFMAYSTGQLELVPGTEDFQRMDVNCDGDINVGDAVAIRNYVLYDSFTGPANARVMADANETMTTTTTMVNGKQRIAINLNSQNDYVALQADIVLANGQKLAGVQMSDRSNGHNLMTMQMADGKVRIMATSTMNNAFQGTEGAVVYIDVEGNGQTEVSNVIFADAAAGTKKFAADSTTGVAAVKTQAQDEQVYSIGGRLMNAMKKGLNIIRRADGTSQKVIK